MIAVLLNIDKYKYDIHSLVKSFFPEQDIRFYIEPCEEDISEALFTIHVKMDLDKGLINTELEENDGTACGTSGRCASPVALTDNAVDDPFFYPKNVLKQLIYKLLCKKTKIELPWGTLTGIRPVMIPLSMLEKGSSPEEIRSFMKTLYYTDDEKTNLAIDIAQREAGLLKKCDCNNGYSLYIGIPFCPTTCLYCSFTSYPIAAWKAKVDEYISCLEKEIDYCAKSFAGKKLDTIYIGGGTPTTLEPYQMDRLLCKLEDSLDLSHIQEFTVESGRPDSITADKLKVMKKHDVTRISVNPQTMSDKTLRIIGRRHTVSQTVEAYRLARNEGFDNINMDIILGLPGETIEDVRHTMAEIEKLSPDDLTVHSLAIKRASRLAEWIKENGITALNNTDEMMKEAAEGAARMGLEPYYLYRQKNMAGNFENTGYAREGKAGLYNIFQMEETESIVALGTGSVSKRVYHDGRVERCGNVRDVDMYMHDIDEMIDRKRKLFG